MSHYVQTNILFNCNNARIQAQKHKQKPMKFAKETYVRQQNCNNNKMCYAISNHFW